MTMSIQPSDLAVSDPLAGREVTIVVRVLPDGEARPARPALVSVGTAGEPPAFADGRLEQVEELIRQAWLAYGVQAEMRAATATTDETETVAEAVVAEEAAAAPPPAVPAPPKPPQPAPRPQNLSLF